MVNFLNNYDKYIKSNELLFESPEGARSVLLDEAEYSSFKETLLEGLSGEERNYASDLVDRQRESILEEADNVLSSPDAIAFSVASLPMVLMTYSTPVLKDGIQVQNIKKSTASIPKIKWKATIIDVDGTTKEVDFPTAMESVRPGLKELTKDEATFNIFRELDVDGKNFRISQRNLMATGVTVVETDSSGNETEHVVDFYSAIDARGHFRNDFEITDVDGKVAKFILSGSVSTSNGNVNWANVLEAGYEGTSTFTSKQFKIKFRIFGIDGSAGIVDVEPEHSVIDIHPDDSDRFKITNISQFIQDWQSLYNIDILSQLIDTVKLQMDLNTDYDIAEILKAKESDMETAGLSRTIDFADLPSIYYNSSKAALEVLIPKINIITQRIRQLTRLEADIIFCGTDMGALLLSIQDQGLNYNGKDGEFGISATGLRQFNKMKIISSNSIDNDKLYILVKGKGSVVSGTLLLSVYKPLVIDTQHYNGKTTTFIYSRRALNHIRDNTAGYIKIENYENFL